MRTPTLPRPALRACVPALLGCVLAGCASVPPEAPVPLAGRESAVKFNTGRIAVVVTDYAGTPLPKARVDVEGMNDSKDYFRTAAFSDVWGRVSFAGVPQRVRVTVYHAETLANYSREFDVPSIGTTELRMMVETFR